MQICHRVSCGSCHLCFATYARGKKFAFLSSDASTLVVSPNFDTDKDLCLQVAYIAIFIPIAFFKVYFVNKTPIFDVKFSLKIRANGIVVITTFFNR